MKAGDVRWSIFVSRRWDAATDDEENGICCIRIFSLLANSHDLRADGRNIGRSLSVRTVKMLNRENDNELCWYRMNRVGRHPARFTVQRYSGQSAWGYASLWWSYGLTTVSSSDKESLVMTIMRSTVTIAGCWGRQVGLFLLYYGVGGWGWFNFCHQYEIIWKPWLLSEAKENGVYSNYRTEVEIRFCSLYSHLRPRSG